MDTGDVVCKGLWIKQWSGIRIKRDPPVFPDPSAGQPGLQLRDMTGNNMENDILSGFSGVHRLGIAWWTWNSSTPPDQPPKYLWLTPLHFWPFWQNFRTLIFHFQFVQKNTRIVMNAATFLTSASKHSYSRTTQNAELDECAAVPGFSGRSSKRCFIAGQHHKIRISAFIP